MSNHGEVTGIDAHSSTSCRENGPQLGRLPGHRIGQGIRLSLDRAGLRLGIRIVVGYKGSRMGLGYGRKSQQMVNRLGNH